jgi:hypothetical protein
MLPCGKRLPVESASATISALKEKTMTLGRLFLFEFGVFSLLFICLLGKQILRHELDSIKRRRTAFGSVEGVVLLAITTMTGARYSLKLVSAWGDGRLPELATGWIAAFGAGCAIYVGVKAVRSLQTQVK